MISYRLHIYRLTMRVSAEATALALSMADCVTHSHSVDYKERVRDSLPDLLKGAASLREAIDELIAALPHDVVDGKIKNEGLLRHMYWIEYRLDQSSPESWAGDPIDIAVSDLDYVLDRFEKWYQNRSAVDGELTDRLEHFIANGELNAATREAWAIFKTRMVSTFGLPNDLDGHSLAEKLFGSKGVPAQLLPDQDRQGLLHLFKGLYTLSRNPVVHNDVEPNPYEAEAVLALISTTIAKLDRARHLPSPDEGTDSA